MGPTFLSFVAVHLLWVGSALAASSARPAETILAGGALAICADLAPRACRGVPEGGRAPPRHQLDAEGILRAADPRLWSAPRAPALASENAQVVRFLDRKSDVCSHTSTTDRTLAAIDPRSKLSSPCDEAVLQRPVLAEAIKAWLTAAAEGKGGAVLDAEALDAQLAREIDMGTSPWQHLTDAERAALRSALERPQLFADGQRVRERAFPARSRAQDGVRILEAFIAAARARAGEAAPRIAIVTASAQDPFDPVDFYESVFAALGAEPQWWPVDAAMAHARFPVRDCAALDGHRLIELGMADRERIYPDLAARARAFCQSDDGRLPDVHGVFFAGGDQWRLRRAFFDADDDPNPWLLALRAAHWDGRVVVGGTSAGAAVQSGAAMLSNGSVEAAIEGRFAAAPPPDPGCARGARCPAGLDEDHLTWWEVGGLGLVGDAIIDTHFSERARELRLLVALGITGADWGYGADETSALRIRDWPDRREVDALGASGGWVFRRADATTVLAWYLAPGVRLVLEHGAVRLEGVEDQPHARRPTTAIPHDALGSGALRDAAARLAWRCGRQIRMTVGERSVTLGCIDGVTRGWLGTNGVTGVGPLRLALSPLPDRRDAR